MPAISTLIAGAGLALAGGSAVMSYSAAQSNKDAQARQLAADQQHANLTNESNLKVRADNQRAIEDQRQVEGISQTQMNLDATRRQREIIRSTQASLAQSHAVASAAGANTPGSSAFGGVVGSLSGREGVNLLGVSQNREAGNAIFGLHNDMYNAYKQASIDGYVPAGTQVANTSGSQAATAAGLGALGGVLTAGAGTIGKVGSYFGAQAADWGASGVGSGGYNYLDAQAR